MYEGDWENDEQQGNGVLKFANGSVYEGEFANGQPHGEGKYTYKTVDFDDIKEYCGSWAQGQPSGYGKAIYNNGDVY